MMTSEYFQHEKALVDPGARVGSGTRIWAFAHVQKGAVVGAGCNICNGSFIENGVVIGDRVTIKHNVSLFEGVTVEDDVFIASNIAFINDQKPRGHREGEFILVRTRVRQGASLGTNAVILGGVTIGEFAFVGAGSVVTKDVPSYGLVYGNPAVIKGYVCRCGEKLPDDLKCSCGKIYRMTEEKILEPV